jgi:Na+-transporting methylmalonyl-CoA/oxaloacetate decarboxylase beta subunit
MQPRQRVLREHNTTDFILQLLRWWAGGALSGIESLGNTIRSMLGLSSRAVDTLAATLAGVVTFLVFIAVYLTSKNPSMSQTAAVGVLAVGIAALLAGVVMLTLAESRERCNTP